MLCNNYDYIICKTRKCNFGPRRGQVPSIPRSPHPLWYRPVSHTAGRWGLSVTLIASWQTILFHRGLDMAPTRQNWAGSPWVTRNPKVLTPWSKVLSENLTGPKLRKKFAAFYETRRFITAFKTAHHHMALSWARWIQPKPFHATSRRTKTRKVQDTKKCCGFFRTGFRSSDRIDLAVTLLIIIRGRRGEANILFHAIAISKPETPHL
jgi:hypothetical protein